MKISFTLVPSDYVDRYQRFPTQLIIPLKKIISHADDIQLILTF